MKNSILNKIITEEINEFVHAVIGKDEWIPIYRVGDLDFNGFGFYFAFDEEYYDYTDTGYKFKDAKKYLLNMNARIWDPLKDAEWVDQISWADIRLPKDFCDEYGIYYEDLSEDENKPDCMTSTDDIMAAGKELGYQAVILREIPQTRRPWNSNGDNYFDEICIFDTSIIKKCD